MRNLGCLLLLIVIPITIRPARADEPAAPPPRAEAPPPATPAKPSVSPPHPVVLYIQDWAHLAEVTRSDEQIFSRADDLTDRESGSRQIAVVGFLLGGSLATVATVSRLSTDHWTDFTKWGLAAGVSGAAVGWAIAWLVAPSHSDLVSVVNEWNQRHPDRPLAP